MYFITARRTTSGELLKVRNGLRIAGGYGTPLPGSSQFTLTTPFRRLDPRLRRSTTFDNDTAFARHALLGQALQVATWFCDAYASWQRGAVESINGRLRRNLPRKIDIDRLSDDELQDIILMHNLTPRKCLAYLPPAQALSRQLGIDVKISFNRGVALHS